MLLQARAIAHFLSFCTCLYAVRITSPHFLEVVTSDTAQKVQLPCYYTTADISTDVTINWTKGSSSGTVVLQVTLTGEILRGKEYRSRVRLGRKASLVLDRPTVNDTSNYTCKVTTFENDATAVVHLVVTELPKIEHSSPRLVQFHKGESVSVSCFGSGRPTPNMTWSKDGTVLASFGETHLIQEGDITDSGEYTCLLANDAGNDSRIFQVEFCDEIEMQNLWGYINLAVDIVFVIGIGICAQLRIIKQHRDAKSIPLGLAAILIVCLLVGAAILAVAISQDCRIELSSLFFTGVGTSLVGILLSLVWIVTVLYGKRRHQADAEDDSNAGETDRLLAFCAPEEQLFVETSQYKVIEDRVLKDRMTGVTVIGYMGDGKTAAARHLALKLQKSGYRIIQASTIEDIEEQHKPGYKTVVVVDDPFGQLFVLTSMVQDWVVNLEQLSILLADGETIIIVTSRTHVWDNCKYEFKQVPPFSCVVDFTTCPLSEQERTQLLSKHLEHDSASIKAESLNRIIKNAPPFGFPQCCRLFAASHLLRDIGSSFFSNPLRYLRDDLESIHRNTPHLFGTLAVVLLYGGAIPIAELEYPGNRLYEILHVVAETLKQPSMLDTFRSDLNKSRIRMYLSSSREEVSFSHDSLYETVALHVGETDEGLLFKYCSSEFLSHMTTARPCALHTTVDRGCNLIGVREPHFEKLCALLTYQIINLRIRSAFQNPSWKDPCFCQKWEEYVRSRNLTDELISIRDTVWNLSVIHWAAVSGLFEVVRFLAQAMPRNDLLNLIDSRGTTVLHSAALGGDARIVQLLLDLGLDPNATDNREADWTPLYRAAATGKPEAVACLLKGGANKNFETSYNISPLLIAVYCKRTNVTEVIKRDVCKTKTIDSLEKAVEDQVGGSAIHELARDGKVDGIRSLLISGSDVNTVNAFGWTPLYIATMLGHDELVSFLLNSGADANIPTKYGNTPLYRATVYGNHNICRMLQVHMAKKHPGATMTILERPQSSQRWPTIVWPSLKRTMSVNFSITADGL